MITTTAQNFNVSKKIAQLTKVCSLLAFQLEEKELQRRFLSDKCEEIISSFMNEHTIKIQEIIDNTLPDILKVNETVGVVYKDEYSKLQQNIKVVENKYMEMIKDLEDNVNKELVIINEEISEILRQLNFVLDNNDRVCESRKEEIREDIFKLKDKFDREIQTLEKNNSDKCCLYKEEILRRHKQMEENHDLYLQSLKNTVITGNFSQDSIDELCQFREKLKNLSVLVIQASKNVHLLSKDYVKIKERNKGIVDEIRKMYILPQDLSDIDSVKEEIRNNLQTYEREVNVLLQQFENIKSDYTKIIVEEEEKIRTILEDMASKHKLNVSKYDSMTESHVLELEALRKQHQKEIDAQMKYSSSKRDVFRQTEDNLQKDILKVKNDCDTDEAFIKEGIEKLREENSITLKENVKSKNLELENLNMELTTIRNEVIHHINDVVSDNDKEIRELSGKLEKLKDDKMKANLLKEKRMSDEIFYSNLEIEELNKKHETSYGILEENLISEYNVAEMLYEEEYERKISQFNEEIATLREQCETEYASRINTVLKGASSSDEYDKLNEESQNEFNELIDKLESIKPPSANCCFVDLDDEINELSKNLCVCHDENENERGSITRDFTEQEALENSRHRKVMANVSSGRAKEQALKYMRKQTTEAVLSRQEEEGRLTSIITDMEHTHKQSLNKLIRQMEEVKDTERVDKTKMMLVEVVNSCKRRLQELTTRTEDELHTLRSAIKHEQDRISQSVISEMNKRHKMTSDLESILSSTKAELTKTISDGENRLIQLTRSNSLNVDRFNADSLSSKTHIQNSIDRLVNLIAKESESNTKTYNTNESRNSECIHQMIIDHEHYIENIKKDHITKVDFYNEKISVLRKDLDAFIYKCNYKGARECDIQKIKELQDELNLITPHLVQLVKYHKKFKEYMIAKEDEYNTHFSISPRIVTLASV